MEISTSAEEQKIYSLVIKNKKYPFDAIKKTLFKVNDYLKENKSPIVYLSIDGAHIKTDTDDGFGWSSNAVIVDIYMVKDILNYVPEEKLKKWCLDFITEYFGLPTTTLKSFNVDISEYEVLLPSLKEIKEWNVPITTPKERKMKIA